jgi:cell division protein FtsZ
VATVIIAVGCVGGRMVNKMVGGIESEFIAINTDRRELDACRAGPKLLIGEARFRGCGGSKPHVIMEESGAALEAIKRVCFGRDSVIIVAGLGGGTGTGVAPLVARIAQRQGCKTVAVVTKPLPWESLDVLAYTSYPSVVQAVKALYSWRLGMMPSSSRREASRCPSR